MKHCHYGLKAKPKTFDFKLFDSLLDLRVYASSKSLVKKGFDNGLVHFF